MGHDEQCEFKEWSAERSERLYDECGCYERRLKKMRERLEAQYPSFPTPTVQKRY